MRIIDYIKDKFVSISLTIITLIIIVVLLVMTNVNDFVIVLTIGILLVSVIVMFIYEFFRKKVFYDDFNNKLIELDKKYFVTELIESPNFVEGKILNDSLYEINKSFIEEINNYKYSNEEFQEYIELWCHEIKTPLATSKLILENNNTKISKSLGEELEKIDNYIEQVLYFFKSKNPEIDYIITNNSIKSIVSSVIKRNKKDLIGNKIKINIDIYDEMIDCDPKWLEFIINQIISNSIKYNNGNDSYISFCVSENKNNIILYIKDNGIGISEDEISRVFDKGFTGSNGRVNSKSTGIGLYLCKKLCDKLGYSINISSVINGETIVSIVFPKSSMIKMK